MARTPHFPLSVRTQIRMVFAVSFFILVLLTGVLWFSLERLVMDGMWGQLENVALLCARTWERDPTPPTVPNAPDLTLRTSVIDTKGKVVEDSLLPPAKVANQRAQPEVREALAGGIGRDMRHAPVVEHRVMFLAVPLHGPQNRVVGALRASVSTDVVTDRIDELRGYLVLGFLAVTLLGGVAAEELARSFSAPLEDLSRRLREPEPRKPFPEVGSREAVELSRALNQLRDEIRRQYAVLDVQHQRLERILTRLDDGIIVVDPAGEVVFANPASLRILGVERTDIMERGFEAKGDVAGRVLQLIQTHGDKTFHMAIEEDDRHLMVDTLEISWGFGQLNARVGVVRDISNFVRLDRMRQDFVANASHELRTPITAVSTALEALEMGAIDDPESRQAFLARARRAVVRLAKLADNLLDLSVAEGTARGSGEPTCDAADVAIQVVTVATASASARGQSLRLHVPEGPTPVPIREVDLLRVIGNVVDNAVKYTGQGGVIEVRVEIHGERVHVDVTDNGRGIPPEHLTMIFERFYRADQSRKDGGAGLGLTMARHLLERCDGTIRAANVPGGGARIHIELPLYGAAGAAVDDAAASHS